MKVWHEDDSFWRLTAPFMFPQSRWDGTPAEVDQIVKLLDIEPGAKIVDMGCGPGRHALEFTRRGYKVTGVDRTAVHLQEAQKRAQAEKLKIEFVQADMRQFSRPDAFDAALSMFTTFGYFANPADNQQALLNVCHSLKNGGVFIMELMGKEVLARIFMERTWTQEGDAFLLQEHKVSQDWSRMENRWILLRGQERHEFIIPHWLYAASELTAMLQASGFATVEIFGNLKGAPYDHQALRLVAVARK
ncbi:MAG: class I SAM-dependent methyltransferase [Chloroflexi bacterium]|nr:class I SAM-dependent methyltransferase [Chloroflexota bacterium]